MAGIPTSEYLVFIASPTDVEAERKHIREFVNIINSARWAHRHTRLRAIDWKDVPLGFGHPQTLTNPYVAQSHLVIMLFHRRFGTPTRNFDGGTFEEFCVAKANWDKSGVPQLKLFFREPSNGRHRPNQQASKVRAFQRAIKKNGVALFQTYKTLAEFRDLVSRELLHWVEELEVTHEEQGIERLQQPMEASQPSTTLIGREHDFAELQALLRQDDVRLVALTGPAGVGKTSLAREVSGSLAGTFPFGRYYIFLEPGDDTPLLNHVAQAVGVAVVEGEALERSVFDNVREKRMLLVIENLERAAGAVAELGKLLDHSEHLKLLVTSRESLPLALDTALEYRVPPLAAPPLDRLADLTRPTAYAAVQLFLKRARAVNTDFARNDADERMVAEICALLDGRPLAIEIAAARANMLTPADIRHEVGSILATLSPDASDAPRAMQSAITLSYQKLSQHHQQLFRRLSVFCGGFSAGAAAAICPDAAVPVEARKALLDSLVSYKLLMPDPRDDGRYTMHERVWEYAHELLEASGEGPKLRDLHAEHFTRLAEGCSRELRGRGRQGALLTLRMEHDNVRAALAWLRSTPARFDLGLRLAGALFWFWNFRGYFPEGREILDDLLERAASPPDSTAAWARAAYAAGGLAFMQGEFTAAEKWLRASVDVWRKLPPSPEHDAGRAYALVVLGRATRDFREGMMLEQESEAIFRTINDRWGLALSLNDLGYVAIANGNPEAGRAFYERSVALWRELEDPWGLPLALSNLGFLECYKTGNAAAARRFLDEALEIQLAIRDAWGVAETLKYLAELDRRDGNLAEAERRFRHSLQLHNDLGRKQLVVDCLLGIARVAADRAAVASVDELGRAARLFAAGRAHYATGAFPLPRDEMRMNYPLICRVRAQLGKAAFAREWAKGRNFSLVDAYRYALED